MANDAVVERQELVSGKRVGLFSACIDVYLNHKAGVALLRRGRAHGMDFDPAVNEQVWCKGDLVECTQMNFFRLIEEAMFEEIAANLLVGTLGKVDKELADAAEADDFSRHVFSEVGVSPFEQWLKVSIHVAQGALYRCIDFAYVYLYGCEFDDERFCLVEADDTRDFRR